jgi:hypothetical protein
MAGLALDFYEKDKTQQFAARAMQEQIELLHMEQDCDRVAKPATRDTRVEGAGQVNRRDTCVDSSISELLEKHILEGDVKGALAIQKKFRVPEKRLWHIEVRTLAKCRAWDELAKLIANKKVPPIGFQPFIEACVEQRAFVEAARYIQRLPDPHERMEWLCNIGYWQEAAEVAYAERDPDALMLIRSKCRSPPVMAQIDQWLNSGQF